MGITALTEQGVPVTSEDLTLAKQALSFLKQQRFSRVDTSRHLNILLNCEAFSAVDIAENAKILLKFVKVSERMNLEAEKLRSQKAITTAQRTTNIKSMLKVTWKRLGSDLEASWDRLAAVLGPSWGHLEASWGRLGVSLGALGALLGPLGWLLGPS